MISLAPIISSQPKIYKKLRYILILKDLKEFNVGEDRNEVWKIMVLLKIISPDLDPGINIEWKANYRDFKREKPGSPNIYY